MVKFLDCWPGHSSLRQKEKGASSGSNNMDQ
ncbi:hypothetical protein PVAP13_7NG385425 [Panicum virgatum]|uniref:Uncharacterized protein n=1 Tax=Panicum virgatum TaxID=38727 RepID=A0A8T0Q2Q9_PANVG|nr:hypothetical protein PVAP13_7NG385425 [Panicum virgatum]